MYVALTYDHRLIDGREAVTFLRKIKSAVEDPRVLLVDLWISHQACSWLDADNNNSVMYTPITFTWSELMCILNVKSYLNAEWMRASCMFYLLHLCQQSKSGIFVLLLFGLWQLVQKPARLSGQSMTIWNLGFMKFRSFYPFGSCLNLYSMISSWVPVNALKVV